MDPSHYAISGELAHGGIGRILRARDLRLDRPVAIKEMLLPAREAESRFVAEALVTARLQHPSIVPVYEAGRWPGGEPFYSMKLVAGRSLADVIAERKTLEERLALLPHVLAVAEAMAYAHSERIIHRDLKPANVLVGNYGETVVIDWGLAKDLSRDQGSESVEASGTASDSSDSEDGVHTRVGTVMGTPAYMPPEQAAGHPVDERADVYALGAILYHLLAGVQPYDGGSSGQVLQRVVQGPPPPLSQRQKCIPVDLLAIVTKAMAREPADRYACARELVEDLRRFQTGQIVGAYEYSRMELLRRFVRRYRAVVAVLGVAVALLAAVGWVSLCRVLDARDRAESKQAEAELARSEAEGARQQAMAKADELMLVQASNAVETDPIGTIRWLRRLSPGFTRWPEVRMLAADARAHGFATVLSGHKELVNALLFSPDGRRLVSSSDDHSLRLWSLEQGTSQVLAGHTDEAWKLVLFPDERSFVSSSKDGTLRRWDLETGEGQVFTTLAGPVSGLITSADGRYLLANSRVDDQLFVWDRDGGEPRILRTGFGGAEALVASPDGGYVLVCTFSSHRAVLGDLSRGTFRPLVEGAQVKGMAFSPSGELVVVAGSDGTLHAFETRSGRSRSLGGNVGKVSALAFSPDGGSLAVANLDGKVWLLDVASGRSRAVDVPEAKMLQGLKFSPDGRYLVAHGSGTVAHLWNVSTGESRSLHTAPEVIYTTQFSPDGRHLATGSTDGTLRLFDVDMASHRLLAKTPAPLLSLSRSFDGQRLLTLDKSGTLRMVDSVAGAVLLEESGGAQVPPVSSQDGKWFVSAGSDHRLQLRDGTTGRVVRHLEGHAQVVTALAVSGDGQWLASADKGGEVRLWSMASGEGRVVGGRHEQKVLQLAFSPDARRLASGGQDKTVMLWDVASGEGRSLGSHDDDVSALAFSPDGRRLVSGGMDHTLRIWSFLEKDKDQRLDSSGAGVQEVLFSPDGRWLVSRSKSDPRLRLWDGKTGAFQHVLRGHAADALDLAFSPDGTRLASVSYDGTVRLWDVEKNKHRVLQGHTGAVTGVEFLPDGRSLISIGEDGAVRSWPDELPWAQQSLRTWMATVKGSEP
ncbi:WD40 repeat domain-containing serine/threonine protein kinase [Archangium lansingense]|uniref:Protein kinase n=1 Tax=Archangium lansingense TaxID=2995310 RepID=A0ABT4AFU7_9BACT|nr:protein kinase [Archangium lansinium]MCY1080044.1 protein kinase [Archangium lansinium]